MIFVTVGTHNQDFKRLVKKIDEIALRIGEEVLVQRGHTKYVPKNTKHFDFASREEMEKLNREADIIVTHAGAGSIIFALRNQKSTIVVPRLKKFGEHIDDHQLELTRELEEKGRIIAVYDVEKLEEAIKSAREFKFLRREKPLMISIIKDYLRGLEAQK